MNSWSNKKRIKIPVLDFFFNMRDVQWKGKVQTVDYDLMTMIVQSWISEGMTKEEALDLMFEI